MCKHNNTISVPVGGGYMLVVCKDCKTETIWLNKSTPESNSDDDS